MQIFRIFSVLYAKHPYVLVIYMQNGHGAPELESAVLLFIGMHGLESDDHLLLRASETEGLVIVVNPAAPAADGERDTCVHTAHIFYRGNCVPRHVSA